MNFNMLYEAFSNEKKYFLDLHTAASIGFEERIRDIIDNLEDKNHINNQNKNGWTPLMYAACCADLKVVLLLLEEGADPNLKNKDNHTALILATKYGSTDVANLLLQNGALINEQDSNGWPPLLHASSYGHRSLIQLLVEKGAQINLADETRGFTALMLASSAGHDMIVRDLLQYGANPMVLSKIGETARSVAVTKGNVKVKEAIDVQIALRRNYFSTGKEFSRVQQLPCEVFNVLETLKLTKYYPAFKTHEIDISRFWLMNEENLKEIGIQLLGPRRKLIAAIDRYHQNKSIQGGNSEERAFANKLLLDNQKLQKDVIELSGLLSQEKKQNIMAEKKLTEVLQTVKNFTDKIRRTVVHSSTLQDQLKDVHLKLTEAIWNLLDQRQYESRSYNDPEAYQMLFVLGGIIKSLSDTTLLLFQQTNFQTTS